MTARGNVVLVSTDGSRWGWPGGRPERGESWEDTLRRELNEEACATVTDARLLGFVRSKCLSGREEGLVLVRSIWRAEVALLPWQAEYQIPFRRIVPAPTSPSTCGSKTVPGRSTPAPPGKPPSRKRIAVGFEDGGRLGTPGA